VDDLPEDEILAAIQERRDFIDGVVISGGEPTIHPQLPDFLRKLKAISLSVKLDTNGSRPQMLERVLRERLVDFVAMDYKAPLGHYSALAGVDVDVDAIQMSTRLLMSSWVDYEFRTTVHPSLLEPEDILQIARELKGAKRYVLQAFYATECLDDSIGFPPAGYLEPFKASLESVKECFGEVGVRGEAPQKTGE